MTCCVLERAEVGPYSKIGIDLDSVAEYQSKR
jgi:hypothetical protein